MVEVVSMSDIVDFLQSMFYGFGSFIELAFVMMAVFSIGFFVKRIMVGY